MLIPEKYQPKLLTPEQKESYLSWAVNFVMTNDTTQHSSIDITIKLEVTEAYKKYDSIKNEKSTFFAFLLWNLITILPNHFGFNLRRVENNWYLLENPPLLVPVALAGKPRFAEMVLENASRLSYENFMSQYRSQLTQIQEGKGTRVDSTTYLLSCLIGNLPNLQFTGLTLPCPKNSIEGQPMFYFGQRYWKNEQLYIPFSAKLHHSTNDPFMLDLLIQDFQNQFI